jgi:hypothetical protein
MLDRNPQVHRPEALIASPPADEKPWLLMSPNLGNCV